MNKPVYKSTGKRGLFDTEDTLSQLSSIGNPLVNLYKVIDFEIFRPTLEDNLLNHHKKSHVGAKPFDVVLIFNILILQRYYGLGDKQTEY